MIMKRTILFLILIIFPLCSFAKDSSVYIHLRNNSNHTLFFDHIITYLPTNSITLNETTLSPGKSITITGITSLNDDLNANVYFIDDEGHEDVFSIIDHRQYHVGQPVFSMKNERLVSQIISETITKDPNPRALFISDAKVEITQAN